MTISLTNAGSRLKIDTGDGPVSYPKSDITKISATGGVFKIEILNSTDTDLSCEYPDLTIDTVNQDGQTDEQVQATIDAVFPNAGTALPTFNLYSTKIRQNGGGDPFINELINTGGFAVSVDTLTDPGLTLLVFDGETFGEDKVSIPGIGKINSFLKGAAIPIVWAMDPNYVEYYMIGYHSPGVIYLRFININGENVNMRDVFGSGQSITLPDIRIYL